MEYQYFIVGLYKLAINIMMKLYIIDGVIDPSRTETRISQTNNFNTMVADALGSCTTR